MESGSTACTTTTAHDSASGCGWSLKKSKRDAAQQRRVQAAQSLKLRSLLEVQDIQQRRQVSPPAPSCFYASCKRILSFIKPSSLFRP